MAENRFGCGPGGTVGRETCCIETGRIYDSCRDRDCFEHVRVRLTDFGNEMICRGGSIRAKDAYIAWTYIGVDPVRFNRGFYTVNIRFFIKLLFEACTGGSRPQEFEGIAAIDKKAVLYGGDSNVSVFRSDPADFGTCPHPSVSECEHRVPTVVVEAVDPVILSADVLHAPTCPVICCEGEIPQALLAEFPGPLSDADGDRFLTVSLGLFSVIRLIRPAQLLVSASEYTVPDKECSAPNELTPCSVFRKMAFPVEEFNPPAPREALPDHHCGCN